MRSFAIEEPGSPVPALYATLIHTTNVYLVGDQRPQQHQSFKDVEGTERLEE